MNVTTAPHISEVRPNSPEFRNALRKAGAILVGTEFSVYSRHRHYDMVGTEVLFEEQVAPGVLALRPLPGEQAARRGLASCWGVTADGVSVALRYADKRLHEASGIDVTSGSFAVRLTEASRAFAVADLHEVLEINIAGHLFPAGAGRITFEVTDAAKRAQMVTFIPTPSEITSGDWSAAACWSFTGAGEPVVTGMCNDVAQNAHGR